MTEFDHLILLIVSGYLLVGYLVYRWITWMLNKNRDGEWTDDDRQTYDHAISMVSTMLLWPKVLLPPLAWLIWKLFLGIIIITLRYLIGRFKRK